jgi:hypothetical protein
VAHFSRQLALLLVVSLAGCQTRQEASSPDESSPQPIAAAEEQPASDGAAKQIKNPAVGITSQDLDRIEAALKIKLPAEYRRFMPARSEEIAGYTYTLRGETELWLDDNFFLDADRLISENLGQRDPGWAAAEAFPRWWKEYFLFGTNGGGDYYAIKLDGSPGVWFLNCDGGSVKRYADSLEDYLAKSASDFPEELEKYKRLDVIWQQKVKGEIDEAEFERRWQAIVDEA